MVAAYDDGKYDRHVLMLARLLHVAAKAFLVEHRRDPTHEEVSNLSFFVNAVQSPMLLRLVFTEHQDVGSLASSIKVKVGTLLDLCKRINRAWNQHRKFFCRSDGDGNVQLMNMAYGDMAKLLPLGEDVIKNLSDQLKEFKRLAGRQGEDESATCRAKMEAKDRFIPLSELKHLDCVIQKENRSMLKAVYKFIKRDHDERSILLHENVSDAYSKHAEFTACSQVELSSPMAYWLMITSGLFAAADQRWGRAIDVVGNAQLGGIKMKIDDDDGYVCIVDLILRGELDIFTALNMAGNDEVVKMQIRLRDNRGKVKMDSPVPFTSNGAGGAIAVLATMIAPRPPDDADTSAIEAHREVLMETPVFFMNDKFNTALKRALKQANQADGLGDFVAVAEIVSACAHEHPVRARDLNIAIEGFFNPNVFQLQHLKVEKKKVSRDFDPSMRMHHLGCRGFRAPTMTDFRHLHPAADYLKWYRGELHKDKEGVSWSFDHFVRHKSITMQCTPERVACYIEGITPVVKNTAANLAAIDEQAAQDVDCLERVAQAKAAQKAHKARNDDYTEGVENRRKRRRKSGPMTKSDDEEEQ